MNRIVGQWRRLLRDESGLSAIEYGILASLIALAALQALSGLGQENADTYDTTSGQLAAQREAQTARANGGAGNPEEPPVAGNELDPQVDTNVGDPTSPDEPPVAAMKAPEY